MHVTGPWSRSTLDEFLLERRIPVRLGCRTPGGHPWLVSLWYAWGDGDAIDDAEGDIVSFSDADTGDSPEIMCATSADADLVEFLRSDPEISFEVSTNEMPYRGVRGRGVADLEADTDERLLRSLFERYLGGTDNELASHLLSPGREEIRIRVTPKRLHTWDFSGRMSDVAPAEGG
ncbi:MAG: pyridoxamine 5'-phosphate oxidase family protein [Halobellus sp.]|uniref:pyridoxamine 5'-phosphate oxidase family protein n=1 Tax=Halobellus sp. TaxID=1979212 RepID=UPI0035D4766A